MTMSLPKVKLREYYFERVNLKLPEFPSSGGIFSLHNAKGKYTTYTNPKKENLIAYRWILELNSMKKSRKSAEFGLLISVVGIFEVSNASKTVRERINLVREYAPKALYEVIKINMEKIFFHALVKRFEFPALGFKKVKNKKYIPPKG